MPCPPLPAIPEFFLDDDPDEADAALAEQTDDACSPTASSAPVPTPGSTMSATEQLASLRQRLAAYKTGQTPIQPVQSGCAEGASKGSTGCKRRTQLMKKLHTLHRLAWARRQEGPTLQKLLDASPELKAANLTSRTDAVSEHYSKSRWEHVASAMPLTHKVKRSPKRPLFLSLVLHSMPVKQGEVFRGYSSSSSALRLPAPVGCNTHRSLSSVWPFVLSTQELCKRLAQHSDGLSTPPNSPGFSFSLGEMSE
jgi:hypothetical protein